MSSSDDDFVIIDSPEDTLAPQPPPIQEKIRKWLDPTEYDDGTSEYIKHLKSHLGGTGDWIEQTPEYQQWQSDQYSNALWIKATAGAGKSVLAARSRARLARHEGATALHFFFRHIISSNRTPKQLVRDWLAQTLPVSPLLQHKLLVDFIKQQRQLDMVTFETLWSLFREVVAKLSRVYCFADALDEMSLGNDDFLAQLVELGNIPACKVFITSRPMPHIIAQLRKMSSPPLQLALGPATMSEDISKYIDHRLDHDISRYIDYRLAISGIQFPEPVSDSPTALLIRTTLKSKAQGSFLYARLMTDNLLEAVRKTVGSIDREDLEKLLHSLPTGLGAMYASMLEDHAKRTNTSWKLQHSILQWVTHSERPLRLLELAAVIDFQKGSLNRDSRAKARVRTACGPLLEILPSDVVGPIHHSFTEYLTSEKNGAAVITSYEAHRAMTECCVNYLISVLDQIEQKASSKTTHPKLDDAKLSYPFLDYAMSNWDKHIKKCDGVDDRLVQLLDRLWMRNSSPGVQWCLAALRFQNSITWHGHVPSSRSKELEHVQAELRTGDVDYNHYGRPREVYSATPMHVAAIAGLREYAEHLISLGFEVEGPEDSVETPMHSASRGGWPEVVNTLLRAGANPDADDQIGLNPLHVAATRNHVEIVRILLQAGIDPWTKKSKEHYQRMCGNGPSSLGDTPLKYVCREGHLETLHAFIPYLDTEGLSRALDDALRGRHTELMLAIIRSPGFGVEAELGGRKPIQKVAGAGNIKCIEALLERGANTNCSNTWLGDLEERGRVVAAASESGPLIHVFTRGQALAYLSEKDTKYGLELLTRAGCDINARDSDDQTPLCLAQTLRMASALVSLGADVRTVSVKGSTPLHRLAKYKCPIKGTTPNEKTDTVLFWLKHGVSMDSRRSTDGRTALMVSLSGTHSLDLPFSQFLLERGADPNIKDHDGYTALHLCARRREHDRDKLLASLIRAGADIHARTNEGDNALHLLVGSENAETAFDLLVVAGVSSRTRNKRGETALQRWSRPGGSRDSKLLQPLLQSGCSLDTRDIHGVTCVHNLVAGHNGVKSLDHVIAAGADVRSLDNNGNNAWHYLAMQPSSDRDVRATIHSHGVEQDRPNNLGCTPFFLAIAADNNGDVEFLVDSCVNLNVNCSGLHGRRPIHLAAARAERLVRKLVELGADLRALTDYKSSVLHFAAQARQPSILFFLLKVVRPSLSDLVNAKDSNGRTALDYAAQSGIPESVDILSEAGSNLGDSYRIEALLYSAEYSKEQLRWERSVEDYLNHKSKHGQSVPPVGRVLEQERDEDVGRGLGVQASTRNNANVTKNYISIRRCILKLIHSFQNALESLPLTDPLPFNFSKTNHPRSHVSVLRTALEADCEPVIEALMTVYQTFSIDKRKQLLQGLPFWQHTKFQLIQNKAEVLLRLLQDVKDPNKRTSAVTSLLNSDNSHLIEHLFDSGMELWADKSTFAWEAPLLLAKCGAYEALERLLAKIDVENRPLYPLQQDVHRPGFGAEVQILKNFGEQATIWDALLLTACLRELPSLPLMRVILDKLPISDLGRVAALFKLASGTYSWNIEALKYMLQLGVDPNCRNATGQTPLHVLCKERISSYGGPYGMNTLKCLLDHGADPNILDNDGASCLIPDLDFLDSLLAHGADATIGQPSLLSKAIRNLNIDAVKLVTEKGVDLNKCLIKAKAGSAPELGKGADPKRSHDPLDDSYPLHLAVSMSIPGTRFHDPKAKVERRRILQILLDAGANPNLMTWKGAPIAHDLNIITNSEVEAAKLLLKHPSLDFQQRDSNGNTLLLALATLPTMHGSRHFELLSDVVRRGADIGVVNHKGQNILHVLLTSFEGCSILLCKDYRDLLSMCQVHGLTNAADRSGIRPMHYCLQSGLLEHAEVLASFGGSFTLPDVYGNTAFHHLARTLASEEWFDTHFSAAQQELVSEAQSKSVTEFGSPRSAASSDSAAVDAKLIISHAQMKEEAEFFRLARLFQGLGIDINGLNKAGEPPMFTYIRSKLTEIKYHGFGAVAESGEDQMFLHELRLLKQAGANFHGKSANGQGILHILATASFNRNDKPLRITWQKLVADGLDPYMEDDEQRTALDVAALSGSTGILELY